MNKSDFIAQAPKAAIKAGALLGVDPLIIVAQAALESGWGEHTPKPDSGHGESYNFYGIKADNGWRGPTSGGHWTTIQGKFRAYSSLEAGFVGYSEFIHDNPRYRHALAVAGDPEAYLKALQQAGYATDPDYAAKVLAVWRKLSQHVEGEAHG